MSLFTPVTGIVGGTLIGASLSLLYVIRAEGDESFLFSQLRVLFSHVYTTYK
jgi:hypothetical protein